MTIVDLKLIFVVVFILAICYQTNVNCFADDFTAFATHKYNVDQRELYEFVTMSELVDRWMNWLPFFMAADFKPLSVGKRYMIFSNEFEYLLNVTEYQEGRFLALESDLLLRPRIVLLFSESEGDVGSELEIRLSFRRTSALFQHTIGRIYRKVLEPKLVESLQNLNGILNQMSKSKCYGCIRSQLLEYTDTDTHCSGPQREIGQTECRAIVRAKNKEALLGRYWDDFLI